MKNINLIIDFDSTFIQLETIEVLAKVSLKNNLEKTNIMNRINNMTSLAMNGKLSFQEALLERIKLINATESDVKETIKIISKNITNSIKDNINFFKGNSNDCYIISGGFKEIIVPIVKSYGIKKTNIFANELVFNSQKQIISVNQDNPLSMDRGKVSISKRINGYKIILGDGYTDYEIKKYGQAKLFIQFIENINRKSLNNKADKIANNFNEVIKYIELING